MTWIQPLAWFTAGFGTCLALVLAGFIWLAWSFFPPERTEG